jgi:hypothetical protein
MTIVNSTLPYHALSFDNGVSWDILLRQPADQKVEEMDQRRYRLDGTANPRLFWNMKLIYLITTTAEYRQVNGLWRPDRQKCLLNYMSSKNLGGPATGAPGSGWVYAPARWVEHPFVTRGEYRGSIVYDLNINFESVEWDGVR